MKFDKNELAKKIREAENLSNEDKSCLLELLNEKKTYGLVWEDSTEDAYEELKTKIPVLREVEDKHILKEKDDEHFPNHILIEGENLLALVALAYTHAGMIDVIYIDPPYNTGNKDFSYNDTFIGEDDTYRHSKWLSFMEKRLKLAKMLLSDEGAIFISIDDNEQAQLKLLCDEIFGMSNFVGCITRATGTTTGQDTGSLGKACDYIIVYSKYSDYKIGGIPLTEKDLSRYDMEDEKGAFSILQLRRTGGEDRREDRPTMFFPITAPDGTDVYPIGPTGYESRWRVGPEKVKKMRDNNLLYFKKDSNGQWKVYYKFYAEGKTKRPSNLWTDLDGNKKAQIELKSIIKDPKFETPKPLQLIKKVLELTTDEDSVILDFFAGSGTTMHATMQLNAEDGGHRQCILITNNENNICEDVTYERNKRVIEGYTTPKGEKIAGLPNNNLRYYKAEMVDREQNHQQNKELVYGLKDLLCIKENLYRESFQFGSLPLKGKEKMLRYFSDNEQQLLMVYDSRVIPYLVKEIERMEQEVKIYLFADGAYPYTEDFRAVMDKVDLIPLPYAYQRAIKFVLPDANPEWEDNANLTEAEQVELMEKAIEAENNEK